MPTRPRRKRGFAVPLGIGIGVATAALIAAFIGGGGAERPPPDPAVAVPPPIALPPAAPLHEDDAVVGNDRIEVRLGTSEDRIGALTVVSKVSGREVGEDLGHSFVLGDDAVYRLPGDALPAGDPVVTPGVDTPLGPAHELRAPYTTIDGAFSIEVFLTVPDQGDSFFLQLAVRATSQDRSAAEIRTFRPLDIEAGRFNLVERPEFLTDATAVIDMAIGDGERVDQLIGIGSPVYVKGPLSGGAVVLAPLEEATRWTQFSIQRNGEGLRLGVETGVRGRLATATPFLGDSGVAWSPNLLFDLAEADTRVAFNDYKRAVAALYPEPPLPAWFGPQWDSFWVYDLQITEPVVRANAEAIKRNFGDLGPWSIIFDAGWYVDSGAPDSAPDVINLEKFPSGLRPVIDYLHDAGMRAILYFSAPYIDSRVSVDPAGFEGPPAWMALAGFIERYPNLIRSLSGDSQGPSFIYDFVNPGLIEYMQGLMRLYLQEFGGDGILLDLVGEASPAVTEPEPGTSAPGGRVPLVAAQSLEVYKVIWEVARAVRPDALVEGAWLDPALSRAYAQTWRYGDEVDQFSFTYPSNGLVQKVDYVILQREMLGMRPHIGYLRGPGTATQIQQWWMGAALALGAEFAISVDFTDVPAEAVETYREYLAQYAPFTGTTRFGPGGIRPDWFATTRDGTTYLGVINRDGEPKSVQVALGELGLGGSRPVLVYQPEIDTAKEMTGSVLTVDMAAASFRLYVLRDTPGVVWGSRRTTLQSTGGGQAIVATPSPRDTGGRLLVYAPGMALRAEPDAGASITPESDFYRVTLTDPGAATVYLTPQ